MTPNETNRQLFQMLRKAIPEIPENVTRLQITLQFGCAPVLECEFIGRAAVGVETHEQQFSINAIDGTRVVR